MIKTKEDLRMYLEADRLQMEKIRRRPRIVGDEIWRFQILLRKEEYYFNCKKKIRSLLYKIIRHRYGIRLGYTIPINVFGPGLCLAHYGTIIVNRQARIGKNCRIHADVNIGTKAGIEGVAPKIGDYCYIGPGVKMFGPIEIGDWTAIGANAVVNKSFPDGHCSIGGIPAKVISTKSSKGLWVNFE
jgi:serine O-acetyltransferase